MTHQWFPEWHVLQVHYRNKCPTRMIGYLGQPFRASFREWYYKPKKDDEWKRTYSYDIGICRLLKHHGLQGKEHTVPIPYHWRDEYWIDE